MQGLHWTYPQAGDQAGAGNKKAPREALS